MYTRLDPAHVLTTLERLEARIAERFPGAGLARVCADLAGIARQTRERATEIARPNMWLRAGVGLTLAAGVVLLARVAWHIFTSTKASDDFYSTLQGLDAGLNILLVMGAALFFLVSLEERIKRRRAIGALHELRSIIHVIDMHQLTKDPSAEPSVSPPTPSSPKRTLSRFELVRYLDYCSEMLSLAAKVAVLYAQSFPDPVVTEAVNDLERTATGLAQKIWAKINILTREGGTAAAVDAPAPLPSPQPGARPSAPAATGRAAIVLPPIAAKLSR
jgi:hypothetical protein